MYPTHTWYSLSVSVSGETGSIAPNVGTNGIIDNTLVTISVSYLKKNVLKIVRQTSRHLEFVQTGMSSFFKKDLFLAALGFCCGECSFSSCSV